MGQKHTRMIEKHYGHLTPGWAGQEIDNKAPRLDLDLAAFSRPADREPKPVIELDPRLKNKIKSDLILRPLQDGQTPRPGRRGGTKRSLPNPAQWMRKKPFQKSLQRR